MATASFLDKLSGPARSAVSAAGQVRTYPARSFLCHEGDPSTSLFIIRHGLLRIERTTASGRRVLLDLAGPGALFGEFGVIDQSPRSATAYTLETTSMLVVDDRAFLDVARRHPEILLVVAGAMADTIRRLTNQLVRIGDPGTLERIAERLVALVDRDAGVGANGPIELVMPISQQELGEWAGLSREATARALRELRERGVIDTGRRRVVIHDIERLRRIATT